MNQQVHIDLKHTKPMFCASCSCESFEQFFYLREIPAIISPTGRREVMPVPAFRCFHCKTPIDLSEKPSKNTDGKIISL